ncbi:MAG: hypothetical protein H8E47_09425 [Anaerolineales bacterium]|nr:hypothetical protein [Anaerolineales bacterium]
MNAERLAWVLLMFVGVILPSILGHWDIALAGIAGVAMLAWALWKEKKS